MQGKCSSLLSGALGLAMTVMIPASLQAAPIFSNIYLFGDSLSDTGNTEIVAPGGDIPDTDFTYGDNGRFSNGRVWAEYLSESLGLGSTLTPSRAGGTNYAHGGAEFDSRTGPSTGLLTQYQAYMSGFGADGSDADALYIVWAGANDLRAASAPGADVLGIVSESIANYYGILAGLIANGAESLLVPNVPNLGRTPEAMAAGFSMEATQLALLWNTQLDAMLHDLAAQTDADIYQYDVFSEVEAIFANAGELGFTNTTEPCSHMEGMTQVGCANPDQYIFWDILHPTTAAHELIGAGAYDLLTNGQPIASVPLPATVWLLVPGLALIVARRRSAAAA